MNRDEVNPLEPKPNLPLTQALIDIKEAEHSKSDESRLLTDVELYEATGMEWNSSHQRAIEAQLAKDQEHEQARVERIKCEIELHGILDPRELGWWQEFWKQEGVK